MLETPSGHLQLRPLLDLGKQSKLQGWAMQAFCPGIGEEGDTINRGCMQAGSPIPPPSQFEVAAPCFCRLGKCSDNRSPLLGDAAQRAHTTLGMESRAL